jgi:hypothetical protein
VLAARARFGGGACCNLGRRRIRSALAHIIKFPFGAECDARGALTEH